MSLKSVTEISEITGKDRRTIKKRLEKIQPIIEGTSHLYETKDVLEIIFCGSSNNESSSNLIEEKTRLTKAQADKAELEAEALKGTLIHIDDVLKTWSTMIINFRARLLALPHNITHKLINKQEYYEIESILKNEIYEALTELAEKNADDYISD